MALFKKRERFDRTDVPKENPYKTQMGIAVIVLCALALVVAVWFSWTRAVKDSKMGDVTMRGALTASTKVQESEPVGEGQVRSDHDFVNTMLLQLGEDGQLASARLLAIDESLNVAQLVNIPLNLDLSGHGPGEGEALAAAQLLEQANFAADPAAAVTKLVGAYSKALGLPINHIVVSGQDFIEQGRALAKLRRSEMLKKGLELIKGLRSDMNIKQLMEFASQLRSIGTDHLKAMDLPLREGSNEQATYANTGELLLALGRIVAAQG